jgi:hypothetical protein
MGATVFTPKNAQGSPQDANVGYKIDGTITMSSSYATGGDSLTAAQCGLGTITSVEVEAGGVASTSAYVLKWNPTNGTIQAYDTGAASGNALAEAASTTDLHLLVANATVYGY